MWGWGFQDTGAWVVSGEEIEGTQTEPCLSPPSAGRMYLFYGNKTSVQFQNFSPTVVHPGDLQTHILPAWPSPLPLPRSFQVCLPGHWEADGPRS